MFLFNKHVPRRTVLKGVGAAIGLPLLEAMIPANAAWADTPAGKTPKRFAFVGFPHGAIMDRWSPKETGADYAMFVFTNDAYGDAGRKAAQAAGMLGCLIGVCVMVPSGIHVGYAGLVDLSTGDVVWFNTDLAMGGDPREVDGAEKRVGQLMDGFPLRAGVVLPKAPG